MIRLWLYTLKDRLYILWYSLVTNESDVKNMTLFDFCIIRDAEYRNHNADILIVYAICYVSVKGPR